VPAKLIRNDDRAARTRVASEPGSGGITLVKVKEITLLSPSHPHGQQQEHQQQVNQGKWTPLALGWMNKVDQIHGIPSVRSLCSLFCGHLFVFFA
jgi:hypothetical protein